MVNRQTYYFLKGPVHQFYMVAMEPSPAPGLLLAFFLFFFIPVATTVDFMVSQIGPIAPLQLLMDHFDRSVTPIN